MDAEGDEEYMDAYAVQYEDVDYQPDTDLNDFAQLEPEWAEDAQLQENEGADFQVGYSDLERYSQGNRQTVDTPENKFIYDLTTFFQDKNEDLLVYIPLIQEIPRYSLKNKEVLTASLEVLNSPNKKNIYKLYELYAKKYNVPISDVHRYYKLISNIFDNESVKKKETVDSFKYATDVGMNIKWLKGQKGKSKSKTIRM